MVLKTRTSTKLKQLFHYNKNKINSNVYSLCFMLRNFGSLEVETWRDLKPSRQWNSFESLMKRKFYNVVGRNILGA
jgi:hypothetical protein